MKRQELNILASKGDNAMSGQKNSWKKALTRTVWIAPALGVSIVAVLLALLSIVNPSHGQITATTTVPDWVGKLVNATTDALTLIP
jgi:hypothetical protein